MTQYIDNPENRANVRTLLQTGDLIVAFTKADGERRLMKATLRPEAIHYEFKSKQDTGTESDHVAVWDLGKNAWRSFRWDSLQQFENVIEHQAV